MFFLKKTSYFPKIVTKQLVPTNIQIFSTQTLQLMFILIQRRKKTRISSFYEPPASLIYKKPLIAQISVASQILHDDR